MKVAILSDIHDHIWNLETVLDFCSDADALICCGDLCSPFVILRLGKRFNKEIHLVFGNNDADLFRITNLSRQFEGRMHIYGEIGSLELGGRRFAVNHFPEIARPIAASGEYDVVCFGHNHKRELSKQTIGLKEVLLINPGPVMGVKFVELEPTPTEASFAVVDTDTLSVQLFGFLAGKAIHQLEHI